ncbi:hypothetical protein BJ165DRAFT_1339892 [Panaeolus papilionaceus]|nr:hypothetical protein BJ165DRAFT_1339892 [Panaeolus papilionaceus]
MSKKDQYHHFIPRFILREFQSGAKKSNKERQEEFKNTGVVNERVYFYNVKDSSLEHRLISTVYGETNLYRNVTNVEQMDEIEEKFSKLDGHCAKLIQDLHKRLDGSAPDQRTYPIMRKDLDQLRKFLFLMHFRNAGLCDSYFDPEHPDHRGVRDVLKKRWAQAPGAKSAKDVWLHAVKYYLDTSHSEILRQVAEKAPKMSDPTLLDSHTLENVGLMDAITYQQQAGFYYLSIVRAAPGHEFILGNNSFGLWEGLLGPGADGLHRIYIVSPRIALILRLNAYSSGLQTPQLLQMTHSDIISINLPRPKSTFAFSGRENNLFRAEYRASPAAERDLFTFPITRLSAAQTFMINNVVLQNIPIHGSLTFKDPSCMQITLNQFWSLDYISVDLVVAVKYLSLVHIMMLLLHGQPDDFNVPLDRDFVLTVTDGELVIKTATVLKKAAARKKRKGKRKGEASKSLLTVQGSIRGLTA